jgi:hypothetical protein
VAGDRWMPETVQHIMELNLENAAHFIKGETLRSVVDKKTGYKISGK